MKTEDFFVNELYNMNNMNNLHSTRDHYEQIEAHFKAKGSN